MVPCCNCINNWSVSDFADISSIVIAIVNLFLAGYIFIYQRDKDKTSKMEFQAREIAAKQEAISLQEQNIRLQWFKELIIQPNLATIYTFYNNLNGLEDKFKNSQVNDDLRFELSEFVKGEGSTLRISFYDILRVISPTIHQSIKENIDGLIDQIVAGIFNPGINLNHQPTFEKEIGDLISYSKHDLISTIYSYKGI